MRTDIGLWSNVVEIVRQGLTSEIISSRAPANQLMQLMSRA